MMDLVLKIGIATLMKLATEKFVAKFVIITLDTWSKGTANKWDDQVVKAGAEALDIPLEKPAA